MGDIHQSRIVDDYNDLNEENWDTSIEKKCGQLSEFAFLRIQAHSEDQIRLVRLAVDGILSEGRRYKRTEVINVPKISVGYIIGKDGSNLRHMNGKYRVKIQVEQSGKMWEKVSITGSEEGIEGAKSHIDTAVARSFRIREMKYINNNQLLGQYKCENKLEKDVEELFELKNELEKPEESW